MEAPPLKLTFQKGPAEGETIEGKPGAKPIRIGRVVKGNTFSIKDPGISSKHLLVEFKGGKWLVSDLGSSNGTFLNGKLIKANVGVGLKDGDLIKIGELTSIGVSIGGESEEEEEAEVEVEPKRRRGRLRKDEKVGAVEAPVPVVSVEEVEKGKSVDLDNGVGRGRRNPRRGAKAAKEEQQEVLPAVKENVGRGRKGVKGSKNVKFVGVSEVEEDEVAESSRAERLHGEREEVLQPEKESVDLVVEKRGRQVGRKGTKKSKNSKNVRCENLAVGVSEMDIVDGDEKMTSSQGEPSRSSEFVVSEAPEVQDELNLEKETRDVLNDGTGINEASKKDETIASMKMTLDQLQKMTLGEWFDFMEVYLVKKIYEETDEIIEGMQRRAEQFEKFMSEQESLKNKSPLF